MSEYLKDKVTIVTGVASGFGKLISEKCAAGGAKVVGVDVNVDGLNDVFEGILAAGFEGTSHVAMSPTWRRSRRQANTRSTLTVAST